MSSDAQAEKHTDLLAPETRADTLEVQQQTDLCDPEKEARPSDPETLQQRQHESGTITGDHINETPNNTPSPNLNGWRLYTVQLACVRPRPRLLASGC